MLLIVDRLGPVVYRLRVHVQIRRVSFRPDDFDITVFSFFASPPRRVAVSSNIRQKPIRCKTRCGCPGSTKSISSISLLDGQREGESVCTVKNVESGCPSLITSVGGGPAASRIDRRRRTRDPRFFHRRSLVGRVVFRRVGKSSPSARTGSASGLTSRRARGGIADLFGIAAIFRRV